MRKRVVIWMTLQGKLKIVLSGIVLAMMIFMFTYELPSTRTWTYWTMPLSGKVIAIDAGHGGPDGGAKSKSGLHEKNVTLPIAQYVRDYLQQSGAIVVLTRETDTDLADKGTKGYSKRKTEDMKRRVEYIRKRKSDMLVSIHLNSITSPRWSGAQTFYFPGQDNSGRLATLIQSEIRRNLANTDRVAKTIDDFYLIKELSIPSALVEVGFLSNPNEAELLGQEPYQKKVAASIYQGILRYYAGEKVGSS